MKDRKNKNKKNKKKRIDKDNMAVLTAECDRMFSVDEKQIELFNKVEANKKARNKANIIVSKISQKIILEEKNTPNDKT